MTDAEQPVEVTFIAPKARPDGTAAMLPTLRSSRAAGDDQEILQLTLHIARPAALFVGSHDGIDGPGTDGTGPLVTVAGIATYRVRVTPELLQWFAEQGAQGHVFGGLTLLRYPDEPDIACVQVTWRGFLDGLTEEQLALLCRMVGEMAKSCCVQLVNEFGAKIPTTY